ncbi:MAG TPA: AMP-binding protein [Acidimicrobiia bacterium]|nr:AMP-binding protein [Acidimicrobiia bacterium]
MAALSDLGDQEVAGETREAWAKHCSRDSVDATELRAALSAGSLPEAFAATARRVPEAPAITVHHRTVAHGELDELAGRYASGLEHLGVDAGSRVLLISEVGVEEIAAYLAVLRVGATAVLANPALTALEIVGLHEKAGSEWLFGSGPALASAAGSGAADFRAVVGLRPDDKAVTSVLIGEIDRDFKPPTPTDPGSAAVLAFTSGTTGAAKPSPLSHTNLLASVRSAMVAWRWSERDHLVHSLPISHQHGLSGIHATLLSGSHITLLGAFDADRTIQTVVDGGASVHFGVPTIYGRLLEALGAGLSAMRGLRLATSGSGPLPIELAERYRDRVGSALLERYGTTESGLNISNPYDGDRVAGSVGFPLPGVEVAAVKPDGTFCDLDEIGEIVIRGPQVFAGYEGVSDADQPFFGGWFRTGDLGARNPENGYFRILGRTKEVIITGGMNVYPREVEEVLRGHPEVTDAIVLGVESPAWGEEVVAVVSPATVDTANLSTYLSERLAGYKRPKRTLAVDDVPRTSVGKVNADAVRSLIGGARSGPTETE